LRRIMRRVHDRIVSHREGACRVHSSWLHRSRRSGDQNGGGGR
jgi:hypothetical protein